ncbi:MAG: hypothetical protein AAB293_03415 [Pseudomonadota bacterium]
METLIISPSAQQLKQSQHVLGGMSHAHEFATEAGTILQLPLPLLEEKTELDELFLIDTIPVTHECSFPRGTIRYSNTREFVFGYIKTEQCSGSEHLEEASQRAYRAILQLCLTLQAPYLLRIWNYVPHINEPEGMIERYRLFNIGRKRAYDNYSQIIKDEYPAACALGAFDNTFRIVFLASTRKPYYIENPRQMNSSFYPEQYGIVPPLFSRATLLPQVTGAALFISGTASIVGHESRHKNNIQAQAYETLKNLNTILTQANMIMKENRAEFTDAQCSLSLNELFWRVYIRLPEHLEIVRSVMQRAGITQAVYVQADICRTELLLEIEASANYFTPQSGHMKNA